MYTKICIYDVCTIYVCLCVCILRNTTAAVGTCLCVVAFDISRRSSSKTALCSI